MRLNWIWLAAIGLTLSACVGGPAREPPAVPAIPAERTPPAPASSITQIWQPGHWDWDGQDYHWADGDWVPRSGHGPLWQDGYWRRSGHNFVWEAAHWLWRIIA